jgi:hypothetical protein
VRWSQLKHQVEARFASSLQRVYEVRAQAERWPGALEA